MSKGKRHHYKGLKNWQLGIEIADETYSFVENSPNLERFNLSTEMNMPSVSIPSKLAEGSARTNKSFSHFLDISLGSSFKLWIQLISASNRSCIDKKKLQL